MRRLIKAIGIAAHILRKATLRSAAVIGLGRTSLSFLWSSSHKCSVGFRTSTMDTVGGQATTDGGSTDGLLLCYNGMTSRLSCCGESVLQMLAQNKAILLWCGDSGTTTARAKVGAVYLQIYDVRHMVKDHSDSEKGNPLPIHMLLFPINSKSSLICTMPQTG